METWYEVQKGYSRAIYAPVQVEKVTDKTVQIAGHKSLITTARYAYVRTEKEAQDVCVSHISALENAATRRAEYEAQKAQELRQLLAQDPSTYRRD